MRILLRAMFKNSGRGKTVAIVQSNYIPWKGYFDLINSADVFILLDDVQYTRRDWRNRNQIKTPQGLHWLTIPVNVKSKFTIRICDVTITDPSWAEQHWRSLVNSYAKAPYFRENSSWVEDLYLNNHENSLSKINYTFIKSICDYLEIYTPIKWSMDFSTPEEKSQRLVSICRQLDANCYLSGPAAKDYLDVGLFFKETIRVEWMDYSNYSEYPQLNSPFHQHVSILDLIFNTGKSSKNYLKSFRS